MAEATSDSLHDLPGDPFRYWLDQARSDPAALAECLEQFRGYLLACAAEALPHDLRVKVSPSDLVQESMLEAHQAFAGFQGSTREDLLRWLARIVSWNAADVARKYRGSAKRELAREQAEQVTHDSTGQRNLVAPGPSPSSLVGRMEQEHLVLAGLVRLPEDYRRVIELRNLQGLSYVEIGRTMGRSTDAVRKLWSRAIEQLSAHLTAPDENDSDRKPE